MNHPSKVLITAPSLDLKKNLGGIAAVTTFIINNNKSFEYIHFELGKHDNEIRGAFYYFRILKAWILWAYHMTLSKFSLIHFNIALEKRSILRDCPLILLAQFFNRKIVIHIHGGFFLENEDAPRWIKAILTSVLSGRGTKIVLSSVEQTLITNKFKAKNVLVLPNSLDIKEAANFNRTHPYEGFVKILFFGRIVKTKGLEYIYEAMKILKERDFKFEFFMAGNGPDTEEYVSKFSKILGTAFVFNGIVSGAKKTELLKESNIFLLPSLYEGLPISLLECMSFAIVPVVTDVGSIGSVVRDGYNGIIIRKESYSDIVEALIKLIKEKDLINRLGTKAQQTIFENFDPHRYIDRLNEIYNLERNK
jgi:glycosyltransferase involved in cell wall biosynthesis